MTDDNDDADLSRQLGERLRKLRVRRRLTLKEVEEQSGGLLPEAAVGSYERGTRTPPLRRTMQLADFYGVPVEAILHGLPDTHAQPSEPDQGSVVIYLASLRGRAGRGRTSGQVCQHDSTHPAGLWNRQNLTAANGIVALSAVYSVEPGSSGQSGLDGASPIPVHESGVSMVSETTQSDDAFGRRLGARLRAIRHRRRMTLQEVERRSGGSVRHTVLSSYERAERTPGIRRLLELADLYQVNIETLLRGVRDEQQTLHVEKGKPIVQLECLRTAPDEAEPLSRYAARLQRIRGDYDTDVLTLRASDVTTLAAVYDVAPQELWRMMIAWEVLAHRP